jgi:hypothetical protein
MERDRAILLCVVLIGFSIFLVALAVREMNAWPPAGVSEPIE